MNHVRNYTKPCKGYGSSHLPVAARYYRTGFAMRATSFFEGVKQAEGSFDGHGVKIPIFYYDGEATIGIFPAKLGALRKLLPDRRLSPARLAPGVGTVVVTCFEYRDTDIGDYNELAIGIPLNEPHFRSNLPGRALLDSISSGQFHSWVHHLPVTTETARRGGIEFYNYPKFLASIEFSEEGGKRNCRLAEGEQEILTMSCKKPHSGKTRDVQVFSHLWMDRQPQSSEFKIRAHDMARTLRPGAASLELHTQHPIAREIDGVLLSKKSISAAYTPHMEGILYGPEHLSLQFLEWVKEIELAPKVEV